MREPAQVLEVFSRVRAVLTRRRVPHAFIGALPAIAWGRVRTTTDVDVVALLDERDFGALHSELVAAGFQRGADINPANERVPDVAVYWSGDPTPVRLDLFVAKTQFEREVIARSRRTAIAGEEASLASPEAAIIYKLIAARHKDLEDVENILDARRAAGEALDWEFLDRWAREWEIEAAIAPYRARHRAPSG